MSQIGTGELDRGVRRPNVARAAQPTGITESLIAPGVTPIGPQSGAANQLAQFDRALGIAGQFANQVTATIERQRFKDEKAQAAQDRLDQGRASIDSKTDLATDLDHLKDADLGFFDELEQAGKSVEDYADDLVRTHTEGLGEAYQQRYESLYKPAMVSELLSMRRGLEEREQDELFRTFADTLAGTLAGSGGNPLEEAKALLGDMRTFFPDMDEIDLTAPLVNVGIEAAQRGDGEGVGHVIELLGQHHAVDQDRMLRMLTTKSKQVETERQRNLSDMLEANIANGTPVEAMEKQIRNFEDDLPPLVFERLLGKLGARESGRVQNEQAVYLNDRRLQVGLGIYPEGGPTMLAAELIQDMSRDAGDPQFISATAGLAMIEQLQTNLKTNAYRVAVEQKLNDNSALPLTSSYDTAIDQAFADRGLVEAIPTDNGQALVRGIPDPAKFAFAADKAGRVTSSARQVIAAGLAGDHAQAQQAAAAYVALHQQNPLLAEQVVQNMDAKAKMRARFLLSRLHTNNSPWNEQGFMQIEPADLDRDTLRQTVWAPDSKNPVRDSKIRADSREFIEEALQDTDFRNGFFDGRSLGPIDSTTAKKYAGILEEEFLFARAMVDSDEMAIEIAKRHAAPRFFAENPPLIWDGEIQLTNGAASVTPDFQRIVEMDLKREGWTEEAIDNLVDNHLPVWNADARAWGFRHKTSGLRYAINTNLAVGEELLIRPYDPADIATIEAEFEEMERKARKGRDRVELDRLPDGQIIPGVTPLAPPLN